MYRLKVLYQFPTWMQHLYSKVTWRRDVASKVAYLTFDDGPIPEVTPQILDILQAYNVKATFFCVGENIDKHPQVFQRIISEGHQVGNHTYNHLKGYAVSTDNYLDNIRKTQQILENKGITSRLFRPPYGRMKLKEKYLLAQDYEIILWDVLTHDYNPSYSADDILSIVQSYTRNGSIINFHDSLKSASNVLRALPQCIEWLQREGYQLDCL